MSIEFALSVLDSTTGNAGLFTGRMAMVDGHVVPEIVWRVPSEAEAFASCWRGRTCSEAARISGMLLAFGPPGLDVQLVEIKTAGGGNHRLESARIMPPAPVWTAPEMASFHAPVITPRMHVPIEEV